MNFYLTEKINPKVNSRKKLGALKDMKKHVAYGEQSTKFMINKDENT